MPGELPGSGSACCGCCGFRWTRLAQPCPGLAGDLVALEDPGLVGVRFVRDAHDGVALILAPLQEPVLALSLLARRRQLAAGEIVTLGVAVAWALAAAHSKGLTHGRLRDADVLIDAAGRPLLGGVGVAGVLGAAGGPPSRCGGVATAARILAGRLIEWRGTGGARAG